MFQNVPEQRRSKGQFFTTKNNEANIKVEKLDASQDKKHNTLQVSASYSSEKLLAKYIELENNLNETAEKGSISLSKEVKSTEPTRETQQKEVNIKDKGDHPKPHEEQEELKQISKDLKSNDHEQYIQDGFNLKKGSQEDKENKVPTQNLREEIIRAKNQYEEEISILQKQKIILEKDMKDLKAENAKLKEDLIGNNKIKVSNEQDSHYKEDMETMSEQVDAIRKEQHIIELENKLKNLLGDKENLIQKLNEAEDDIRMKDKQIEGLKFDVNHMKDFIFQHHSESFFATTEDDDEDQHKTAETIDIKSPRKPEPSITPNSVTSFPETLDVETMSQKSLKSPMSGPRPREDVKEPIKNSIEKLKPTKLMSEDIERNEGSVGSPGKKSNKNEGKCKQQKESEPANKRLEKLVKELNEKLILNEKNTKKEIEARVLEASRQFQHREQKLYAEIENLKEDKKALLKKIEDMEWEKAYEYSDRLRKEKLDKEIIQQELKKEQANNVTAEAEAKKKKKKKKKAKTNETNSKEKNESDSD